MSWITKLNHRGTAVVAVLFGIAMLSGNTAIVIAQEKTAPPTENAADQKAAANAQVVAPKSYEQLLDDWKTVDAQLKEKQAEFDKTDEIVLRDNLRREFADLVKKSEEILEKLRESAIAKIEADGPVPAVVNTLMGILVNDAANGRDDVVLKAADRLIAKKVDPRNWEVASNISYLTIAGKEIFEELIIRHREAEKGDLPRVKIVTNRGEIVVELYENEAPNTVANFISLAKSGFYNNLNFHRVIEGFMAQTGSPKGDGSDGPGHTIEDECRVPEFRRHFTGVLSMAKTSLPDSGGSQFFITFSRGINVQALDGKHTVFGRVISGHDVLGRLTRTHEVLGRGEQRIPNVEADKITTIEVIRDRGHGYEPKKLMDKEAKQDEAPQPDEGKGSETDPPVTDEKKDADKKDVAPEKKDGQTPDNN
jgi:cyclophilin family peptidyl-prolyl cis-trans isomerase